jgi:hypothetical protein
MNQETVKWKEVGDNYVTIFVTGTLAKHIYNGKFEEDDNGRTSSNHG